MDSGKGHADPSVHAERGTAEIRHEVTDSRISERLRAAGAGFIKSAELGAYSGSVFHAIGVFASSSMGSLSDRVGPRRLMLILAGASTVCSFGFGWLLGMPGWIILAVGALYAFTGIGDSPILSTVLTRTVPPSSLGSALALRSLLGFGAGAVAPLAFGAVLDASRAGSPRAWGLAFAVLGMGGVLAVWSALGAPRDARKDES